jgi:hypothetical protein
MPPTLADDLRFRCHPGWCTARGVALIALWLALVAGFVAQTTAAASAPAEGRTAAQRSVGAGATS